MKLTSKKLLKDVRNIKNIAAGIIDRELNNSSIANLKVITIYNQANEIERKLICKIHFANQPIKLLPKNFPRIGKTI